jgi:hypothetical protein
LHPSVQADVIDLDPAFRQELLVSCKPVPPRISR